MGRRLKLTAMELGSLSMLALATVSIAVILSVKNCSESGRPTPSTETVDSIASVVKTHQAAPDSLKSAAKAENDKDRRKKKKTIKQRRKVPAHRNHLDEPAND